MSNHLPSGSSHLFYDSAEQLAYRLELEDTDAARAMAREARALAARFAEWHAQRPQEDIRLATIQALFDLNRRAIDYLDSGAGAGDG